MFGLSPIAWSVLLILTVTWASAWYPLWHHPKTAHPVQQANGAKFEALASGIFLGAGMLHMLAHASKTLDKLYPSYPLAFLLATSIFLLLLLLEHISRELHAHRANEHQKTIACLATLMLSLHSILAGSALGMATNGSALALMLVAILSHKWATSFALAVRIALAFTTKGSQLLLFACYASMAPLGALLGHFSVHLWGENALWTASFNALSAGTFLYIGTLHGLARAVMIDRCCNLRQFAWMLAGFSTMALLAIWA